MADSSLAVMIGTQYARMLHQVIPQIEEAISHGQLKASYTVTANFKVNGKTGGVDVILNQKASIPMDDVNLKLSYNSGQLALFEASETS